MTLRKFCLSVVAIAASLVVPALAGLEQPALALFGKITLQSGGVARTAIVVEHQRLKKARRPVIVVLHGGKASGGRMRRHIGLGEVTRSAGAVMVYPDTLGGKWSDGGGPGAERDAQFIIDLVNKLVADGVADRRRIFVAGIGSGGLMAMRLACEHSDFFAGVAVLLAAMPVDQAQTCRPARPIKFMLIAGTADPFVPFHGGKANSPDIKLELLGAEETLAVFGKAAGCAEGKATTAFPDRDQRDGTRAYADKLKGCKVPIELIRIEGGGHTIPGRSAGSRGDVLGPRNNDVDAATLIWDFFRRTS